MKAFVIVATQEQRLRFRMMKKEHGLLHDKAEKKSYAIVKDAFPTNWPGRYARAYLVHETSAQSVELDGASVTIHGGTVEVKDPLNMVAKIRMPGQRGEDGGVRETHLTAEAIYDRTLSAQVRRLGNRRFQWFHALAFASVGATICLLLVGVITVFSNHETETTPVTAPIVVTPGTSPAAPQSSAAPPLDHPVIVVQPPQEDESSER
jgi:hypothetical protein